MKTIKIKFTETSSHEVTVNVPANFHAGDYDLEDGLAELENDGFRCLEREIESVEVVEFDEHAAAHSFAGHQL